MSLLELDGVTVTARFDGGAVEVLRGVGFGLAAGEVLGIVGESGAGKSMIGRLIARLLPPRFEVTAGRVAFDGTDLLGLAPSRHRELLGRQIAFIPQEPLGALNPVRSIGDQFAEHLARLGVPRAERRALAIARLRAVHLPDPSGIVARYPHQLSGGMCQRVLIAMAFAGHPRLVVADEPTTALDVVTQARIMRLLRELQAREGTAVILITHDLRLAAHVCDQVLVMYAGDVVEHGPARRLMARPRHPYTRALKRANPSLEGPRRRLPVLPDHMPGLLALRHLPGCRFAPRCPTRDVGCAARRPPLRELAPGQWARCTPACAAAGLTSEPPLLPPAPAGEGPPLVELAGVWRRFTQRSGWFGRRRHIDAVADLSLTVRAGEFVGLVGESGSGKSTVARLIVGLDRPTAGRVLIEGRDPDDAGRGTRERLETVQMVFQDPQSALNPRRTLFGLVTQAMEAGGRRSSRDERLRRALELLRETGLPADALGRYPAQISGGQRQRVNIARALCVTPKLLVADEIVSGLDVSVQAQILDLLLRLNEELGIALLFISHDLSVVRHLCSRVLVMKRGRVVEQGPTETIFRSPQHPYTRSLLAAVPPDDLGATWAAPLAAAG